MATPQGHELEIDLDLAAGPAEAAGSAPEIWMDPVVAGQIERYAGTDTTRELGGVLLGELVTDGPRLEVRVLAAIEAKHTEAVQSSVTFTHDTWEDIHREREARYPHMRIVGWFHTHPGFGIFLSRWDLFIQHNFFNLPWQIAYVVDPLGHTSGFFRWEAGAVVAATPPQAETAGVDNLIAPAPPGVPASTPARAVRRRRDVALGFAAGAVLTAACTIPFVRSQGPGAIERLAERPAKPAASGPAPKTGSDLPDWSSRYTVKPGDSLWSIAEGAYGDGRCAEALRILNRLPDPDYLPAGATVLLPREDLARALAGLPGKEAGP